MPSLVATSQNFSLSSRLANNPFVIAAHENYQQLSDSVRSAFTNAIQSIEKIQPVFRHAVSGLVAQMDKIAQRGKAGQLPFFQAGIGNGGENLVVGMIRKFRNMTYNQYVENYRHGT